ncbi:MAG TPA: hypothetical protein PK285_11205 [Bacteroidales bacterium]|nr:hypothetical protein [Bacteroidales bacterium]
MNFFFLILIFSLITVQQITRFITEAHKTLLAAQEIDKTAGIKSVYV